MRITSWTVEGFGTLAGHSVDDLSPGLSIVHGPNEAGKSTLLDFVRGVLFGYPDRGRRLPRHEPLRGGRHGGSICLEDDFGGRWRLERYADRRNATLIGPDGSVAADGDLRRLLGGTDGEVFGNVFAFGLAELATLDKLERDDVRELIFSAGVLGAGRSVTRAARTLKDRQDLIVRLRQQDARANKLRRRLDEIDTATTQARHDARGYPDASRALARLQVDVDAQRRDLERIRERRGELQRLSICQPVLERQQAALDALDGLAPVDPVSSLVVARREVVARIAREQSGHLERRASRAAQRDELREIARSIADELAHLGGGAGLADALARDRSLAQRDRVQRVTKLAPQCSARVDTAEADLERERVHLASCVAVREATRAGSPTGLATGPALMARAEEIATLRALVLERDQLAARRRAAADASRLAELAHGARRARGRRTSSRALGAVLLLLGLTVAAAAVGAPGRPVALVALLAVVATVLGVVGVVLIATGAGAHRGEDQSSPMVPGDLVAEERGYEVSLDQLTGRIAHLAERIGIPRVPSASEVDAESARVDRDRDARRRLDDLEVTVAGASSRVEEASRRLEHERAAACRVDQEVSDLAVSLGLPADAGHGALLDAMATLDRLADLDAARTRLVESLTLVSSEIERFETEVGELLAELADAGAEWLGDRTPVAGDVVPTIAELEARLVAALAATTARVELEHVVDECHEEIARALGQEPTGSRLRSELDDGDLSGREQERQALATEEATANERLEALVGDTRDAQRKLDEAERSARLAELSLERSVCCAELEAELEEYATLGIARALLERTLLGYERDRQPAVVARAAELFRSVTDGRYVRLVARAGTDTTRSRGIDAVAVSGEHVDSGDLSRGTAEQLYLCLRLALACSFSERTSKLPMVLDDVFVNFDPRRAAGVARVVADVSTTQQVLAFTCHPHVVELLVDAAPQARVVELPDSGLRQPTTT